MNITHHQMNGQNSSEFTGTSLGSGTTSSGSSEVIVRNPPSMLPNMLGSITAVMSSMSLETLGLDMSLEEAVNKVRELAKENTKLRDDAQKNNQTMKQQYQTLSDWKARWELERDDVKKRHDQAKTVVTNLRDQIMIKDDTIKELQLEIAQQDSFTSPVSQSAKAEVMSLEQAKADLEKKCGIFSNQIQVLVEELQEIKTTKEEQSSEMDKYVRIVHDNEQKITQLSRVNRMLEEEVKALKKLQDENNKLKEESKKAIAERDKLKIDIEQLRSYKPQELTDLSLGDMKSYVKIPDTGKEESDSVPFFAETPSTFMTGNVEEEVVRCAAKPECSEYFNQKPAMLNNENKLELNHQGMSDLLSQLQVERNKSSQLLAESQTKNQELEALHRKVHAAEEKLAESDYKCKISLAKKQVEQNREAEELRIQLHRVMQQLDQTKTKPMSNTSMENQPHLTGTEEEMKNMRVQVTSLVGELQEANDRYVSMRNLYEKQKERINCLESEMEDIKDQLEIQRRKDDELIETLRVTINNLEIQLAGERREKEHKERSAHKINQDYGVLVKHYHDAAKRSELLQKELDTLKESSMDINIKQQFEERIDNLTAQLITAEESMQERTKKLVEISQEKAKLQKHLEGMRDEMDMVAVHKAQAEVYKADFTAEREAREKAHAEIATLKDDISQLNIRNQQIQEDMDHMSQNQIAQMQMRHGAGFANINGINSYGVDHLGAGLQNVVRGPPVATEQEERIYECPKCGEQSPDLDSLQLHVLDCIV